MSRRLGIIGDGQLGGFICVAANRLGIQTTMLSSSAEGVAGKFADKVIRAEFSDQAAIDELIASSDVITFELEDVPVTTLQRLDAQDSAQVFPRPSTMMLLQNKGLQKDWLVANGFPTAPHLRFDDGLDAQQSLQKFGDKFIIKTQRGGYDGLGVKLVKDGDVPAEYATVPTIAEQAVDNFTEIAALVARNEAGHCVTYPLFESIFDASGNVVRRVVCPADVSKEIATQAAELAGEIVSRFDGVGIFAVEYFLTDTELLVNEIAPRVHNVGHLTMEASNVSQFEQHVRAVMGMEMPEVTVTPAVMDNLLYEEAIAEACHAESGVPDVPEVTVHWYGKSKPRPLRKMGHLTAVSQSVEAAATLANQSMDKLRT